MTAAVVALAIVTIVIALLVIAWAVRALFFRDLGQRARPRHEPADDPGWGNRSAGIAAEPPEYLPATVPEFTYGPSVWAPPPVGPVPGVSHDDFRPPQWYHEDRPAAPAPAGAAGLLVLLAAAIVRDQWQAEVLAVFPPDRPWPGDDTLTGMRAIEGGA